LRFFERLAVRGFDVAARGFERLAAVNADAARTSRFLREHVRMEARASDIYVASYPRSGTTWMQMVLHQLTTDGALDFAHISEVQPWYERSLALGTRTASSFASMASPRVFKSHLLRQWLPRTGRFVYVVRDVCDVVVSYHRFYESHLGYRGTFDAFFDRFVEGHVQYRSWFDHVAAWRDHEGEPDVFFVDYGAMKADPVATVQRLATWLGSTSVDVERAVERSSFAAMKAHESKFDPITEHLIDRGHIAGRFLREGNSGVGASALTDAQRARLSEPATRRVAPWDIAAFLH
jgi:hypothetical protein